MSINFYAKFIMIQDHLFFERMKLFEVQKLIHGLVFTGYSIEHGHTHNLGENLFFSMKIMIGLQLFS